MDQLSKKLEEDYSTRSSMGAETAESLTSLAEEIKEVLLPVQPAIGFREWLGNQLSAVVRQRLAWRVTVLSENHRRTFILGAVVGALLPVLGALVYLLSTRLMYRPEHAAPD